MANSEMTYLQSPYFDASCAGLYADSDLQMDSKHTHSASPTSAVNPWTVGHYSTDSKMAFFLSQSLDSATPGIVARFPSPPFPRAVSPSYTNASTCSSSLSPPRESDYCPIYSPPTPSDPPLLPQYEGFSQVCEYTDLADGFVNLDDVNPVQDLSHHYFNNLQLFNSHPRTCSVSSIESNVSPKTWNYGEIFSQPRPLTPDTPEIEEEIRLPNSLENGYAPEEDEVEAVIEAGSPYLKSSPSEDDEDADEYSPFEESRNGSPKPTRNTKSQKRRSTSQSFVVAKRPKTTVVKPLIGPSDPNPSFEGAKGQHQCPECSKSFQDQVCLNSHVKKQHTRPFTCIFEFAGCPSTFPSKNEWKRHCTSQHVVLQYWVCQQDGCAEVSNKPSSTSKRSPSGRRRNSCPSPPAEHHNHNQRHPSLPNGTIFNRKDLYTQHLRRMHVPAHLKNKVKSKTPVAEWEEQQRVCQNKALKTRCHLPEHMACPAPNCNARFDGRNAWDDRMEHVAKHLEKAAAGTEPPVPFGSETDESLINWATSPEIGILRRGDNGRWTLQNPLKVDGYHSAMPATEGNEDADAEGEEIDE
ncbi:hypothetical protein GGR50DRAFT_1206 [Xylaria sp. CBS 124048]|nr:hypothetical protein GGR50DRAFT_1206 [Xylaria sp. CBS 124048]